jgi:tripartite-type tricarboxylate transporter receptor subunit TctC
MRVLRYLATALALQAVWVPVQAQTAPARAPMRFIVPFPAGGSADLVARTVARGLGDTLGQQVVVDNRAGAGGTIGMGLLARAAPDGLTVGLGTISTLALAPSLFRNLAYDPETAFEPITLISESPFILAVNPAVPARTLAEFIDLARAQPGRFNYGSIGSGTMIHFAGEHFSRLTGIRTVHVPYKGAAPALVDLLAGQVQFMIDQVASFQLQNLQAGRLRALAIAGPVRLSPLPDVTTAREAGLADFELVTWFSLMAPRGMPPEALARIGTAARNVLGASELREVFREQGVEAHASSPRELADRMARDRVRWAAIIKATGFQLD